MTANRAIGQYGERLAARYLAERGLEILDRNWRCRDGELDIVARDDAAVVFCEVKTRSSTDYGYPAEAVDGIKAARIRRLALAWLADHRSAEGFRPELRFDVISVVLARRGAPSVEHRIGAF
ncbi:MAG: YraN family protein [Actinobacteria bacterium]|nr:YraN family protein [Actinomycetota bacterium]